MKQLEKNDLKEGEIYKFINNDNYRIFILKWNKSNICNNINNHHFYKRGNFGIGYTYEITDATPEEKHWLETCIKAYKFVSYEEAMKTFTIKKPEFVLPEIWWVRITEENLEDVCKFLGFKLFERVVGNIAGMCKHFRTGKIEKGWNGTPTTVYGTTFGNEITTEQFRKYVLKIEDKNVSKFINNTTVINKEGEVFKIGDIIKSTNGTLKDKIISFRWKNDKSEICAVLPNIPNGIGIDKIELYIEPKVEPKQELSLLEQAKLKYPVGTKFKVACQPHIICTVLNHDTYYFQTNEICNLYIEEQNYGVNGATVYYKGKWAEIVEDFVLPKYWWIEASNISEFEIIIKFFNTKFRGTILNNGDYFEGCSFGFVPCFDNGDYYYSLTPDSKQKYLKLTLEQFKKYVLNEKV